MAISALDLTQAVRGNERGIPFGMDKAQVVDRLRRLADEIDSNKVLVQGARVLSIVRHDDYPLTTLRLTFVETLPKNT